MWLTLVALVVPLGLDTFAVAAALGISGLPRRDRLRVTLLFTAFEAGMPLIGFLGGAAVGRAAGDAAELIAIAILIGLGAYILWPGAEAREDQRLRLLTRGLAAIVLGISISLDELAIGFTIGLLRLPVPVVVVLIGAQAFLLTQLGLRLGARIGEGIREGAERLAGVALAGLGLVLLGERLLR